MSTIKRLMHGSAPPRQPQARGDGVFPPGVVGDLRRDRDDGDGHHRRGVGAQARQRRPGRPGLDDRDLRRRRNQLPAGEVGLVYIGSDWGRGFRYAGDPALTESIYRGNLTTLGDLGYLDDDGYLFVVDRRKDMVITGGANVYPAEVEAVLVAHPDVAEVAVIGLPDDEYGEIVTAVVVPSSPGALTADTVIAYAASTSCGTRRPGGSSSSTRCPRPDGQGPQARPPRQLLLTPTRSRIATSGSRFERQNATWRSREHAGSQLRRSTIMAMPWPPPTHIVSRP